METLYGKSAAEGIAWGKLRVILHGGGNGNKDSRGEAIIPEEELARFSEAVKEADEELESLKKRASETVGDAEADIFEIHRLMMQDEDFTDRITDGVLVKGMTAESAVLRAGEELAVIFMGMDTEYMRARAADIRSVAKRLADILDGGEKVSYELDEPSVIATDDLTPAETVCLDKTKVLGIVTEFGSQSSHTAILARSMGIPAVVGVANLAERLHSFGGAMRECILDGTSGVLYLDPDEAAQKRFREESAVLAREEMKAEAMRGVALVGENGIPLKICANAADLSDVEKALENDAEGIGLFRSEFLFMQHGRAPTEDEQFAAYRAAAERMDGRECVIRTLDAGADKQISYLNTADERNPALGMRAVRICLRNPDLLYTQFRALYRAANFGNVSAMVPMVVLPTELEQVRVIAAKAEKSLREEGVPVGQMRIGMMIETPAAAICADIFAEQADFFSIGTNDLIQYTLAADRENREVAYLAEPLPECVKRMVQMTCEGAAKTGIPVSVCGELAGDVRYLGFLLSCGITKLSVSPPNVLKVRLAASECLNRIKQKI